MPTFDVRFLKNVTDDTGHDRVVCQCHFRVQAADRSDAMRSAEGAFCHRREIDCWRTHAEEVKVELSPDQDDAPSGTGAVARVPSSDVTEVSDCP